MIEIGEISRQHGNTPVRTLRETYGPTFAEGCADDDRLGDVLKKLDVSSMMNLLRDHKDGNLEIICRDGAKQPDGKNGIF